MFRDTHFVIYFPTSPKLGNKLRGYISMCGKNIREFFCSVINSVYLFIYSNTLCLSCV